MSRAAARRMRRGAPSLAAGLLLAVALSGCLPSGPAPTPANSGRALPDSVTPIIPLMSPAVLAYCPLADARHFSGYALAVDEVYICRSGQAHATNGISGYGPWESAFRVDDPATLLDAYRTSNARRKRLCTGISYPTDPLIIWVHHDGVTRSYYAPVTGCGVPTPAARTAYETAKRTLLVDVDLGAPHQSQVDVHG